MKTLYSLLLAIISVPALRAQMIETYPPIVQRSAQGVAIMFHSDQGGGELATLSATDSVYVNAGVVLRGTEECSHLSGWLDNSEKYKLKYGGICNWILVIPSIDEYFGLSAEEEPERLVFQFRNADGTLIATPHSNADMEVEVAPEGYTIRISSPQRGDSVQVGEPVEIVVYATQASDLSLCADSPYSKSFATGIGLELRASYTFDTPGTHAIYANGNAQQYGGDMQSIAFDCVGDAGVYTAAGEHSEPRVSVVDGLISIEGPYTDAAVYDMTGCRYGTNQHLSPGIYLVRVDSKPFKVRVN